MRDAPAKSEARLLVVDDEPTILELLAGTLRFAGFDVLTAVSGAEALRAAAAAKPDLILLDVMMPDCDGFDVIRRIRAGGLLRLRARHQAGRRSSCRGRPSSGSGSHAAA